MTDFSKELIVKTSVSTIVKGKNIFIPENATNGDAIKMLFPNMEITRIQANCVVIQMFEPIFISCAFNLNWWNAKYKEVSE